MVTVYLFMRSIIWHHPIIRADLLKTRRDIEARLLRQLRDPSGFHAWIALNPEKMMHLVADVRLRSLVRQAHTYIDGVGYLLFARKVLGFVQAERYPGIDLLHFALRELNRISGRLFIWGGTSEVLEKSVLKLAKEYPQIQVVGAENGFQYGFDEVSLRVRDLNPQLVVLALGSPKQEHQMGRLMQHGGVSGVFMGVGGSLDVLTGKVKRAPQWMSRLGLEWLFRLLRQPQRIFRQRRLVAFVWRFLQGLGYRWRFEKKQIKQGPTKKRGQ